MAETFQRLLTLDPENALALNYLGYMLADRGIRLAEAETLIARALKSEPENGAYLDSMGWVYYRQGRFSKAMEYIDRAVAVEEKRFEELKKTLPDMGEGRRRDFYENLSVIHDHADVEFAGDVESLLHQHLLNRKVFDGHAQYGPCGGLGLVWIDGLFDSTHSGAACHPRLGFHHHWPADLLGDGTRFLRRRCHPTARDGDVLSRKQRFALVLV